VAIEQLFAHQASGVHDGTHGDQPERQHHAIRRRRKNQSDKRDTCEDTRPDENDSQGSNPAPKCEGKDAGGDEEKTYDVEDSDNRIGLDLIYQVGAVKIDNDHGSEAEGDEENHGHDQCRKQRSHNNGLDTRESSTHGGFTVTSTPRPKVLLCAYSDRRYEIFDLLRKPGSECLFDCGEEHR
jgi:hypothetical protein